MLLAPEDPREAVVCQEFQEPSVDQEGLERMESPGNRESLERPADLEESTLKMISGRYVPLSSGVRHLHLKPENMS